MNKQGKRPMISTSANKRSYVAWTSQMDAILSSTLIDQMNEGNKGELDFKPQAYQAVVDKIRSQMGMQITTDHAKNRIKVWKKHHAIITDIQTYTKFKWNDEKKMVEIDIHDLQQWIEYCKENPNASAYSNKRIDNWDDICTLVSVDRAIGDGAEQHEESAAAVEVENEGGNISEANSGESLSKKFKRDRLADAVSSFAESFKEYVQSKNSSKLDSKEVYGMVSKVVGLSRHQRLKATKQFIDNPKQFEMLKGLPENEQYEWVLLCLE